LPQVSPPTGDVQAFTEVLEERLAEALKFTSEDARAR
jgi:hypothetical protein